MVNLFNKSNFFVKLLFSIFTLLLLLPASGAVSACYNGKYYLPSYAPSIEKFPENIYNIKASSVLANLKGPKNVKAGESFTITLATGEGFPLLRNQEVSFFESYEGQKSRLIGISRLDYRGMAELELSKKLAGKYKYDVVVGPFQNAIELTVLPSEPAAIREQKKSVCLEVGYPAEVEFLVEDAYGNTIEFGSKKDQYRPEDLLDVTVIDPNQNPVQEIKLAAGDKGHGHFTVNFLPEQTGDYLVEALLTNTGISSRTTVQSREFGNITGISLFLKDPSKRDPLLRVSGDKEGRNILELGLQLKGEHGITRETLPEDNDNIILSTDHPELVSTDILPGGRLIVSEKGRPGIATITATYLDNGNALQDSLNIRIAGIPAEIKLCVFPDGLTAGVEASLLCKEGLPTYETTKKYHVNVPPKVNVLSQNDFINGKASFMLEAIEYGSYEISVISGDGISKSITVDFKQSNKPAKHVVLFVKQKYYIKDGNSFMLKTAPWISKGHVLVPIDFIADIFGVHLITSPQSEIISLKGKNREIIIDQDKQIITVIDNNLAKEHPIGPGFMQKNNGNYFVPAAIIARILGAQVDYLPKRGNIEHVTFTIPH
ncbi:MAG TPA: hypothetical protein GX004_10175 [Firmicutes bacterium]|jgi:hypothetical protein|nr:hypothetical protein [Bacillota bacterium]